MMQHLPILPILIPMLAAVLLLLPPLQKTLMMQRLATLLAVSLTVLAGMTLMLEASAHSLLYMLGDWRPPFGIVLLVDPLAALLVTLASFLCLACLIYASAGQDRTGVYFHPLFLFQLMGINGAFLTGDLFNLFVFFEILLIASYSLLIFGSGKENARASFHYVTLNLLGSAFFLFALGIVYGALGTLNMADMAVRIASLTADKIYLAKAGGLLLVVVFGLKSAMVPLHFWLTHTYVAAIAPVAALFAIMTKVGIYSLLRVHTQVFGAATGDLAQVATPVLWPLAVVTVIVGAVGVLASKRLKTLTANLVLVSVGSLLLALAMHREEATAAAIYYLVHSTLATAALFLLVDMISVQRGPATDQLVSGRPLLQTTLLGGLYFIAALVVIGLPPFSGFVGKVLLLIAADGMTEMVWVWSVVLISSLGLLVALSRAGTTLFWGVLPGGSGAERASWLQLTAVGLLLLASILMVVFGAAVTDYAAAAAARLHAPLQVVLSVMEVAH